MATSQPTMPDGVQTLKFKHGLVTANQNPYKLGYDNGTIYFAEESASDDPRSYIYLNGKNIIPELLDVRNGGLGTDFSLVPTNALYIRGGAYESDYIASAKGALYVSTAGNKPTYGTLPVSVGGTGNTSFKKNGVVYASSTSKLTTTSAGTQGQLLSPNSSAVPSFASPTMTWNDGTENGPTMNFTIQGYDWVSAAIPAASDTTSGIVTTVMQNFAGNKIFNHDVTVDGTFYANERFEIGSENQNSTIVASDLYTEVNTFGLMSEISISLANQLAFDSTLGTGFWGTLLPDASIDSISDINTLLASTNGALITTQDGEAFLVGAAAAGMSSANGAVFIDVDVVMETANDVLINSNAVYLEAQELIQLFDHFKFTQDGDTLILDFI